jgi:hypothetical protein
MRIRQKEVVWLLEHLPVTETILYNAFDLMSVRQLHVVASPQANVERLESLDIALSVDCEVQTIGCTLYMRVLRSTE